MSRKQEQGSVFIATDYFAGGKEKRKEILAQPEACCNVCSSCICDCDVECSCGCALQCILAMCNDCVGVSDHMALYNATIINPLFGQQETQQSSQGDVHKGIATHGATVGGVVGGGATFVYAQTVSYWWE